jgi:hypothetical protein
VLLKNPPVTPSPTPRMSLPETVASLALEPGQVESAPFLSTIMEATQHGTREEPRKLSSLSSSASSSVSELSISQTQMMQRTTSIQLDDDGSEATSY